MRWNSSTRSWHSAIRSEPTCRQPGLTLSSRWSSRKRLDRPHGELGALDGVADLADETGRLRRGDRGDGRLLFQEQHVGLAGLGETVRDGTADGPAADDDNFSLLALSLRHGATRRRDEEVIRRRCCCRHHRTNASTLYSLYVEKGPGT